MGVIIKSSLGATFAIGLSLLAINGANADVVLTSNLTQDNCSGGCSTGQAFGTTMISQASAGADIKIVVQLGSDYAFNTSTGLDAFVFNPTFSGSYVTPLQSGFAVDSTLPVHEDGFNSFTQGLTYSGPKTVETLTFFYDPTDPNYLLSLSSFALSSGNGGTDAYFAADITNAAGTTGPVGGLTLTTAVPEPSTWAMMILGFAGLGFMAYRRKTAIRFL